MRSLECFKFKFKFLLLFLSFISAQAAGTVCLLSLIFETVLNDVTYAYE